MRSKRQGGEEHGGGRGGMGGELHADQLVLEIIVVLGVKYSSIVFLNSFYLNRKLTWKLWKSSRQTD